MAEENNNLLIPFLEYSKNWRNKDHFPTYEPDEETVRNDMQYLYDEIKAYLNTNVAGILCQVIKDHMDAPVVTGVQFKEVAADGDNFTLTLDITTSDGEVVTSACNMTDLAEAVRDEIGSGLAGIEYDSVDFAWVFTYTDGRVDHVAMPASERNAVAWVSLDTPGAAHTPEEGYAVGLQWLRPAFVVDNLALEDWTLTKGSGTKGDHIWTFTADGSTGSIEVSQSLSKIGEPGEKVYVQLLAEGIASHQSALTVNLNEVDHDLMNGGGVFETTLDSAGHLIITVTGSWTYSSAAATVTLKDLVVVNSDAIETAAVGCRPLSDWPAFIEAYAPFKQVSMPRTMFIQNKPGDWVPISYEVLPVIRGGTGLTEVENGALLVGAGEAAIQPLAPGEDGKVLQMVDGMPVWTDVTETVYDSGFLRYKAGTYEGNASARTITLPVTPKILWIVGRAPTTAAVHEGTAHDTSVTIMDGMTIAGSVPAEADGTGSAYVSGAAYVALEGDTLKFTSQGGTTAKYLPKFMNISGRTYKWFALY